MMRVLSLGAGVQSTTIALMAERGDIPPLDCAIFADTQAEPSGVYRHLEWLTRTVSFPVHVISKGSLRQEIYDASAGIKGAWGRPPLFLINPDGSPGMTRRQCTGDYKIDPIMRKVRELAGVPPRSPGPRSVVVEQLIGISLDEAHRMRDARFRWIRHTYPLIDLRMTREACLRWMSDRGYPRPPKSACTFCPFHSDAMWREMKETDPESFADAVSVDAALRSGKHFMLKGQPFIHRGRIPLSEVDFTDPRSLNGDLFGEECEGACGV
jgi:hypothetical protein